MPQSYARHAHHPWLTYLAAALAAAALLILSGGGYGLPVVETVLALLILTCFVLISISRLYITKLQDRIIRLEMRQRLRDVLPPERHALIAQLRTSQLVGLRFASDAELPALAERAVAEHLSRDAIKRSIREWVPDEERT